MENYFIGVDVGSGSVRAALVTSTGNILKTSVKEIQTWKPAIDFFEQSSNDIWSAIISVVKDVVKNVNAENVKGIGFDATCSLVVLDKHGNPLTVSPTGNNQQNIVMWMDHRAKHEAKTINDSKHAILKYVGGKVSLEMEMPKLLWIKKNLPSTWNQIGLCFDLPDFLTWKSTGSKTRSLCSLVCKWNYEYSSDGHVGWNEDFLEKNGLLDLTEDNYSKIGKTVLAPGVPCGNGLTVKAAKELGLPVGTPVATSIIDAHAGGLGMIGCDALGISRVKSSRLGMICGTSTCHMAVSQNPVMVEGVWGPFFSAMVPNMWLSEGGQSASGLLLDYLIDNHPASLELSKSLKTGEIRQHLRDLLQKMARDNGDSNISYMSRSYHMWPDYHGNRSPIADPNLTGSIVGLTLNSSVENLALNYLTAIQALAYGTRHIMESLISSGHETFQSILICGGLSQDPLFVQTQADVIGLPVVKPLTKESVLLGAAILGGCAAKYFESVDEAIEKMGGKGEVVHPDLSTKNFHDKKYKVFLRMLKDQLEYREIMK